MRWLLGGLLALVLAILVAWGALVIQYSEAAGPDVPKWQLALFIADEVGARIYCAVTGCPAELPEGMTLVEWAGQDLVPSTPVALDVDPWGRVYVAEGDRNQGGAEDNRRHMYWLHDDLASSSVEERRAYYEKWVAAGRIEDPEHFTKRADRAYVLSDENGDGLADAARELARWNDWVNGIFAGVLWRDGDLYATEIPSLFLLRGVDGKGPPAVETLATGFGVKTSLSGHDMHGLVEGPDGKIYFSIGDRGYDVVTREGRRLVPPIDPGRGAVFRMNPDGSGLEVFAEGLRNPQELAFDDHGNLFTGDNNGDGGDKARIVYVVEGGDSGWAMPYQTLVGDYLRGQWNAERLWHLQHATQPAWIVPPIAHLTNGPSGLAHYPGLGLPERYRGHFFLCDYRYQPNRSQIWSFAVEPAGAGFRMVDAHPFVGQILVTDVGFGYDGRIFAARYNQFASTSSMVVMEHAEARSDPRVAETVRLAQEGMRGRASEELAALLGHADRRIRQRAQQEWVRRGEAAPLAAVARDAAQPPLARIHALWGLGQLGAEALRAAEPAWAPGSDPELRAQAAKLAGEAGAAWLAETLLGWLSDESPRVRFFAAQSLGKLGRREAIEPLFALLRENADRDVFLRHAAVYALHRIGAVEEAAARAADPERAVRLAALLVLRRAADPRVEGFLRDPDALLVVEAARAIHDLPIRAAYPALAALAPLPGDADPQTSFALHRRVIDANIALGTEAAALALAAHAANPAHPLPMRALALEALGDFAKPGPRELAWGSWRPLPERDPALVHAALDRHGRALVEGELGERALEVALAYDRVPLEDEELLERVEDDDESPAARAASLRALASRAQSEPEAAGVLEAALAVARASDEPLLRAEARDVLASLRPEEALAELERARFEGERVERQRAFAALARLDGPRAETALLEAFVRLEAGALDPGVELELLDAAHERATPALLARVAALEAQRAGDLFASRRWAVEGGDAERGRLVFQGQGDCQRCHGGEGHGAGVGPELAGIGERRGRDYLLRSLLEPSAEIAEGFATVAITKHDGSVVSGTLIAEEDGTLVLEAGGDELRVPLAEVKEKIGPVSAMPPNGLGLAPRDLRDLVAYVATL